MKKLFLSITLALLFVSAGAQQPKEDCIEVSGYSRQEFTPNEIYISFTINEKDSKNKISVEEQEKQLTQGLQKLQVDADKSLKIKDMSNNFKKYWSGRRDIFQSREYELVVNNSALAGAVFQLLEEIGITNGTISRVDLSNLEQLQEQNRVIAVKNAKAKAEMLATAIGQSIGVATYIQDNNVNYPRSRGAYNETIYAVKYLAMDAAAKAPESQVEFKKVELENTVFVRFILNK